jgi:hypothetical protein
MNGLFKSQDSKFAIRTALYVSLVPLIMLGVVIYSVWLLLSLNFSYFLANGIPLDDQSIDVFMDYLLKTQVDYFPYVGLFFVAVFFIGLFLSYIILRPFNELALMCQELIESKDEKIRIVGLEKKKLLIKLGNFLCKYNDSLKSGLPLSVPEELRTIKKPMMDYVFYFQFFCIIFILMTIATVSLYLFADHLHESIIQTAIEVLRAPKGLSTFLTSQKALFDLIVIVPAIVGVVLYLLMARLIIGRVQGVTYGYVRDVCEVVNGNVMRRLSPRQEDPGRQAALAVNEVLDSLHPRRRALLNEDPNEDIALAPSKA